MIEFRNVYKVYDTGTRALNGVSLKIEDGEFVFLVGPSGSGKSTVIKLLTAELRATAGSIMVNGFLLDKIKNRAVPYLRRTLGVIFQDFGKYAFTVSENIAFGDVNSEIDNEKVRDSAKASSADTFIDALPKGYDTPLMRVFELDGIEPSIGQWQKIAIARAFYSDSDVLILDEPTASLDAIAEQEIFNQFDLLRKEKTTVFVSHRLSSATIATKILVLNNGELVEEGNHSELMQKKGKYLEMFKLQAQNYIGKEEDSDER
jgi:ABC-type multidrug transport system fused ATPase/permease subunit